jgi:hypothetical protein
MRVNSLSDELARELALVEALRPIARSEVPYQILREAALSGGLTARRLKELRRVHHNLERTMKTLTREKLVKPSQDGVEVTKRGRALVRQVRRATDAGFADEVTGRLILIRDAPGLDAARIDTTLGRHGRVVRSEGSFVRIAILADDYELASGLLAAVRRLRVEAEMTRIVAPPP